MLQSANVTRLSFVNTGAIPTTDNTNQPASLYPMSGPLPATGPQNGIDRGGNDLPNMPITLPEAGKQSGR